MTGANLTDADLAAANLASARRRRPRRPDRMTVESIAELEAAYLAASDACRHAEAHAARERDRRDQAIRDALAAGWTQRQIAASIGLTRSRVAQIAHHGR